MELGLRIIMGGTIRDSFTSLRIRSYKLKYSFSLGHRKRNSKSVLQRSSQSVDNDSLILESMQQGAQYYDLEKSANTSSR